MTGPWCGGANAFLPLVSATGVGQLRPYGDSGTISVCHGKSNVRASMSLLGNDRSRHYIRLEIMRYSILECRVVSRAEGMVQLCVKTLHI